MSNSPNPLATRGRRSSWNALDLYCGAGGVSRGLAEAGFTHIVGIDIRPQPRYPRSSSQPLNGTSHHGATHHEFMQADALSCRPSYLAEAFDFVWASPPCQRWTKFAACHRKNGPRNSPERHAAHPDLLTPTRRLLQDAARLSLDLLQKGRRRAPLLWVIENVPGAPLRHDLTLCGAMFPWDDLRVYRHRHFEANFPIPQPPHPPHQQVVKQLWMDDVTEDDFVTVCGHFRNPTLAAKAMGLHDQGLTGRELAQSIPPPFARYIGRKAIRLLSLPTKRILKEIRA